MSRLPSYRSMLLLAITLILTVPAEAQLPPGTIVVVDRDRKYPSISKVVAIDPETGDRTTLSSRSVGSGPYFTIINGIAIDTEGNIYVADHTYTARDRNGKLLTPAGCIFHIDAATGERTIVWTANASKLPGIPIDIVVDQSGQLFVDSFNTDDLYTIDPKTGESSVVFDPETRFRNRFGLGIDQEGNILDVINGRLARIDREGNVSVLSGPDVGEGPPIPNTMGSNDIAVDSKGTIYVNTIVGSALMAIDPKTGLRTEIIPSRRGDRNDGGIAVDASDQVIMVDDSVSGLVSLDPKTGIQTIITSRNIGKGPRLRNPEFIAIVPGTNP